MFLDFLFFIFVRVGIDVPTIEVRFEHLSVETETHVGSRALPTFFNFFVNKLEVTISKHIEHSLLLLITQEIFVFNHFFIFV